MSTVLTVILQAIADLNDAERADLFSELESEYDLSGKNEYIYRLTD